MHPADAAAPLPVDPRSRVISVPKIAILVHDIRVMASSKFPFHASRREDRIISLFPVLPNEKILSFLDRQQADDVRSIDRRARKREDQPVFLRQGKRPFIDKRVVIRPSILGL